MTGKAWNLVADIGGTNARFGLVNGDERSLAFCREYPVAGFKRFDDGLEQFLDDVVALNRWAALPDVACLAVASPIDSDVIDFTNSHWRIDRTVVAQRLQAPVEIINDFVAVGYAVTELADSDWYPLGTGQAQEGMPIAVLGPGTGLGVCGIVPHSKGFQVIESAGGHVDFAPLNELERVVMQSLSQQYDHVSVERLLSGAGIVNIYRALAAHFSEPTIYDSAAAVTEAAVTADDPLSVKTLDLFCAVLGSVAGNLALTLGAKGGVYIAGGIVPRITHLLEASDFRQRFEDKGRFRHYLSTIPVRAIIKPDLGLAGAIKRLEFFGS